MTMEMTINIQNFLKKSGFQAEVSIIRKKFLNRMIIKLNRTIVKYTIFELINAFAKPYGFFINTIETEDDNTISIILVDGCL